MGRALGEKSSARGFLAYFCALECEGTQGSLLCGRTIRLPQGSLRGGLLVQTGPSSSFPSGVAWLGHQKGKETSRGKCSQPSGSWSLQRQVDRIGVCEGSLNCSFVFPVTYPQAGCESWLPPAKDGGFSGVFMRGAQREQRKSRRLGQGPRSPSLGAPLTCLSVSSSYSPVPST